MPNNTDPTSHPRRCPHGWCSDCATRRGRNRGNRLTRKLVRTALRRWIKDER